MKEIDTDILIVGSGLVGLVAAHSLASLNYKVTIVDRDKLSFSKKNYNDTRTVAVSEGSKLFLQSLSLWNALSLFAEPIKYIKVYDRKPKNKILFSNKGNNAKLGYVIENKVFSQTLFKKLKKLKNATILTDQGVKNIKNTKEFSTAFLNDCKINSKLIIAADGKKGHLKKMVGIKTFKKKYTESAFVLSFLHDQNLNSTAYEIFYETGPLAILPMKKTTRYYKSTIIWSNGSEFLNKLKDSKDDFLLNFLQERVGNIVGNIIKINSKQIFPLSAHINKSFVNKRLVFVGDSAHSIHPIAGQGWNLGVKDVINLYEVCKRYPNNIGSGIFCSEYNDLSYHKAFQLFQITDKLNSHFKNNNNILRFLSITGFNILNKTKFLKSEITKYAMGV